MLQAEILPRVTKRRYAVPVSGVELAGIDSLKIGPLTLVKPSIEALQAAGANTSQNHVSGAVEMMTNHPWLMGDAVGTERVATSRFRSQAELAVGLLAIFASASHEHGATSFRICVGMTPEAVHGRSTFLRWEPDTGDVTAYYNGSSNQELKLDAEAERSLHDDGVFDRAFVLVTSDEAKTELEDAVIRAVHWFSDAQRDPSLVMQFVKYWSCVETFFSQKDDIVRSVSTGLATVLVAGGGSYFPPGKYSELKRRITKLYGLRCKALHGGSYKHVTEKDVADLSQWTAWMVIIMVSLIERGYERSAQVRAQTERLDSVMTKAALRREESSPSEGN